MQDRCTSEHGGSYIQDTPCSKARNLSFVPGFTRPCTLYVRLHVDCASVTWGSQRWLQEERDWIAGFWASVEGFEASATGEEYEDSGRGDGDSFLGS